MSLHTQILVHSLLKEQFTPNIKLTPSQVFNPLNFSGTSRQNSVAAFSPKHLKKLGTFLNLKKQLNKAKLLLLSQNFTRLSICMGVSRSFISTVALGTKMMTRYSKNQIFIYIYHSAAQERKREKSCWVGSTALQRATAVSLSLAIHSLS